MCEQGVGPQLSQHLRRGIAIRHRFRQTVEQLRSRLQSRLRVACFQIDLHLHQFSRQVIRIIPIEIAGKRTCLIDLAQAEVRFRHVIQTGARIRFLSQNLPQVFDRNFQIAWFARAHLDARAQNDRSPILRVVLQDVVNFILRVRQITVRQ